MILAYAIGPWWMFPIVLCLLIGVPVTFAASLIAFALSFSQFRRRQGFRGICLIILTASIATIISASVTISVDRDFPSDLDRTSMIWGIVMLASPALSGFSFWRASPDAKAS